MQTVSIQNEINAFVKIIFVRAIVCLFKILMCSVLIPEVRKYICLCGKNAHVRAWLNGHSASSHRVALSWRHGWTYSSHAVWVYTRKNTDDLNCANILYVSISCKATFPYNLKHYMYNRKFLTSLLFLKWTIDCLGIAKTLNSPSWSCTTPFIVSIMICI